MAQQVASLGYLGRIVEQGFRASVHRQGYRVHRGFRQAAGAGGAKALESAGEEGHAYIMMHCNTRSISSWARSALPTICSPLHQGTRCTMPSLGRQMSHLRPSIYHGATKKSCLLFLSLVRAAAPGHLPRED